MIAGSLFALAACFIWGLIFIVPTFIKDFSPIEIALGRHFVYGSISLLILLSSFTQFRKYPLKIWLTACLFALVANIFYYCCVVFGVKCSSPCLTALILGMSPIVISFYGNWLEKEGRLKDLVIPALLIFIGLIFVNLPAFQQVYLEDKPLYWFGALAACGSLLAWSWYVVTNARFLKSHPHVASGEWSTLMGTSTFIWVLLLGGGYEVWQGSGHWQQFTHFSPELKNYLVGCLVLGILCSWLGSFLWNKASKRLPVSLAGELSIFETLFGLLFFYSLEKKFPPFMETIGILLMLSAVFYSMSTTMLARSPAAE